MENNNLREMVETANKFDELTKNVGALSHKEYGNYLKQLQKDTEYVKSSKRKRYGDLWVKTALVTIGVFSIIGASLYLMSMLPIIISILIIAPMACITGIVGCFLYHKLFKSFKQRKEKYDDLRYDIDTRVYVKSNKLVELENQLIAVAQKYSKLKAENLSNSVVKPIKSMYTSNKNNKAKTKQNKKEKEM